MFPRWWPVVLCGVACAPGCAAEQLDDIPNDSGAGAAPAAGSNQGGSGSGGDLSTSGTSTLPQAGTTVSSAGSTGKGGTGSGGTNASTAGSSSHAGSAGSGAGGGTTGGSAGSSGSGAGGTAPADTSLPFSEDFEDGQANGFIPYNEKGNPGTWVVVADGAGKVYQPQAAVSSLEFSVGGSTAWKDVAMTVKVRLNDADADARILLRFKEPKTYLVVEMAEGKYKLRGRAAGSTTDLISPSPKPVITAGTWYTVGITVKGTTVDLTLDGKAIGGPVMCNATISNGGMAIGADSGSVSFDDISVTAAP